MPIEVVLQCDGKLVRIPQDSIFKLKSTFLVLVLARKPQMLDIAGVASASNSVDIVGIAPASNPTE